jgi:hypothetical protein
MVSTLVRILCVCVCVCVCVRVFWCVCGFVRVRRGPRVCGCRRWLVFPPVPFHQGKELTDQIKDIDSQQMAIAAESGAARAAADEIQKAEVKARMLRVRARPRELCMRAVGPSRASPGLSSRVEGVCGACVALARAFALFRWPMPGRKSTG